jgi:hypothetical protein
MRQGILPRQHSASLQVFAHLPLSCNLSFTFNDQTATNRSPTKVCAAISECFFQGARLFSAADLATHILHFHLWRLDGSRADRMSAPPMPRKGNLKILGMSSGSSKVLGQPLSLSRFETFSLSSVSFEFWSINWLLSTYCLYSFFLNACESDNQPRSIHSFALFTISSKNQISWKDEKF